MGETLTVTRYGRTGTNSCPTPRTATFTVAAVAAEAVGVQAQSTGATICRATRAAHAADDHVGRGLVGIHHTAYQGGCLRSTATRQGATETRGRARRVDHAEHGEGLRADAGRRAVQQVVGDGG